MAEPGFEPYRDPPTSGLYTDSTTGRRRRYQIYQDPASVTGYTRKNWDSLDSSNNGQPMESYDPYDYNADQELAQNAYGNQRAAYDTQQAAASQNQSALGTYFNNQAAYADRARKDVLSEGAATRRNAVDLAKSRLKGELQLQQGTLGFQREDLGARMGLAREQLGWDRDKYGQGLAWDKDRFGQQIGFDREKFGQGLAWDKDRFGQELGWKKDEFGQNLAWRKDEFGQNLAWDKDKYGQGLAWDKDRFGQQIGFDKDKFAKQFGLDSLRNADDTRLRALSAYGALRLPGADYTTMASQAAGLMPVAGQAAAAAAPGTTGSTMTPEQWQAFISANQTDQNYRKLGQGKAGAA